MSGDVMKENLEAVNWLLEKKAELLTDWEEGFLNNLRRRLCSLRGLTATQQEVLDKIWNEVMNGGRDNHE